MSIQDTGILGAESLGADINKQKGDMSLETKQGAVTDKLPELKLDMKDEDLVKLIDKWESAWKNSSKKNEWEKQIEENEKYWLGKQTNKPDADKSRAIVDNLIFEALETFLPQATRRNPEPLVSVDNSEKDPEGNEDPVKIKYTEKLKGKLVDVADKTKIRLKLKKAARQHAIYQLGVAKLGWDLERDMPDVRIIRPKRVILDPDAVNDEDGYSGDRIGEYRRLSAGTIKKMIEGDGTSEEATKKLEELAKEGDSTIINFQEWWTKEYMCWRLDKVILLKKKNPHWNYESQQEAPYSDQGMPQVGPDGQPLMEEVMGNNHFTAPKMPFIFLTMYTLGDQPMDKTGLINQNLANQDVLNKRNKQIDKNVDNMNGGIVISMGRSGLTQPQAEKVQRAIRKGGAAMIPDGVPLEAINKIPGQGLPADVYNELNDKRSRLRDIFGISGSSQAGLQDEDTVRGKILSRGLDTDRIGGGITEHLEQFADDIFNWVTQLLYVYDNNFQFLGGAVPPKVIVSIKEGSMLPKDSASLANQALELAKMNKISNLDLFKRLEYPNAEELAANVWLETNAPQILYKNNPMIQEALAMQQAQAQAEAEAKANETNDKGEQDLAKTLATEEMKLEGKREERSMLQQIPQE